MKRPSPIALVADSQELFSYSLTRLLEQHIDFHKVIATTNFADTVNNLTAHPGISFAAFELHLPGMDGLKSIAQLRTSYPHLRIAIIASSNDRDDILRALAVGLHGYLPRSLPLSEAIQALTAIANGHIYVPPILSEPPEVRPERARYLDGIHDGQSANPLERLTARQRQVLGMIAQGSSNKQIAVTLNLAEGTVKAHVSAIFRALHAHDRVSVAAIAAKATTPD